MQEKIQTYIHTYIIRKNNRNELRTIATQSKHPSKHSKGRNVKEKAIHNPMPICISNILETYFSQNAPPQKKLHKNKCMVPREKNSHLLKECLFVSSLC